MFITSRWSSLQKRHPHACPKEMWHFAFCTVAPQLGDVKTSRRVSAIGSHLRKRVWRCFECQRSRRSSLEQEQFAKEKNEGTKKIQRDRTHSEHHTIIRYSSDIYGSYNSAGGQWLVHTAMRSGLGPDHVSSRRTAMAVSGCPHVVLRARWVWLGLPAKKALWKLWKSWK